MDMQDCIEHCIECHRICTEAAAYCLDEGGVLAQPSLVRSLLDCAQICQTSADFMLRLSDHHAVTCRACAEICEICAKSCEEHKDDEEMVECAELCRDCARACREMARDAGLM
jgi:hypothetical protein